MTTNELLTKHNFLTKILLTNGEDNLSKDLRVKIMAMRIEYGKIRKQVDEDMQEFAKGLVTDRFTELQNKPDRTEEEESELKEMIDKINSDYNSYGIERGKEEVEVKRKSFTEEEYEEIVAVNSVNDVDINGNKIPAPDFLEILYTLFVC